MIVLRSTLQRERELSDKLAAALRRVCEHFSPMEVDAENPSKEYWLYAMCRSSVELYESKREATPQKGDGDGR